MVRSNICLCFMFLVAFAGVAQPNPPAKATDMASLPGDALLAEYFRAETARLADRCLAEITSLADWKAKRQEYRRQLQEMLGLWPLPDRTDLKPVITGRLEHEEFTVKKLHFQASPGLYVTANVYVPKGLTNRVPAILYVCGHSRQFTNGVSVGNKTGYQHYGAWFARNGYVCLTIDTLQLGEIPGEHHGTYRQGQWWWNARGYTPAGVEAWFGIRALDYLCSRPEVDAERIGMTGRSGGGSYSWTVAALDDRVKVIAPAAGITDLQNYVVDGCIEGHCDCMFFVNTYRWDYPQVAALLAPRPVLIVNTDKDRIFPLDGVLRLHEKTRRIYQLHGKTAQLGLLIAEGPHGDSQDLQLPVFRWFNRWLKGERPVIEMAATKLFQPVDLKVFSVLPADECNTRIQENFVPAADPTATLAFEPTLTALRTRVFAGWPAEELPLELQPVFSVVSDDVRLRAWDFTSQDRVRLRLYHLAQVYTSASTVELEVLDEGSWSVWLAAMRTDFGDTLAEELALPGGLPADAAIWRELKAKLHEGKMERAWVAPRGIGLTAWSGDERACAHIRRRFMLLGQTLDGMRVWDIRRAAAATHLLFHSGGYHVTLRGRGPMGVNALYAALFEPGVKRVELSALPASHREGPDYLNVMQVLDIPQARTLAAQRVELQVD